MSRSSPEPAPPSAPRADPAAPTFTETTTFVSRRDGTAVVVTLIRSGGGEATLRLRVDPPRPGDLPRADLEPDEAWRLAERILQVTATPQEPAPTGAHGGMGLSDGPEARPSQGPVGGRGESPGTALDPPLRDLPVMGRSEPENGRHTVVATEGTSVTGLRQALASLPAEARLRDFATDAEVVLVFDLDGSGTTRGDIVRGRPEPPADL